MDSPISDEFIKEAKTLMSDPQAFESFKNECLFAVQDYYSKPDTFFLEKLGKRMEAGKIQYGDKIFSRTAEEILGELQEEGDDIIVYLMIMRFITKRGGNRG